MMVGKPTQNYQNPQVPARAISSTAEFLSAPLRAFRYVSGAVLDAISYIVRSIFLTMVVIVAVACNPTDLSALRYHAVNMASRVCTFNFAFYDKLFRRENYDVPLTYLPYSEYVLPGGQSPPPFVSPAHAEQWDAMVQLVRQLDNLSMATGRGPMTRIVLSPLSVDAVHAHNVCMGNQYLSQLPIFPDSVRHMVRTKLLFFWSNIHIFRQRIECVAFGREDPIYTRRAIAGGESSTPSSDLYWFKAHNVLRQTARTRAMRRVIDRNTTLLYSAPELAIALYHPQGTAMTLYYPPLDAVSTGAHSELVKAVADLCRQLDAFCDAHPGFHVLDAVFTFCAQVYLSDRTPMGVALAIKVLVKDLRKVAPEYLDMLNHLHVFDELQVATTVPEARPYVPTPTEINAYVRTLRALYSAEDANRNFANTVVGSWLIAQYNLTPLHLSTLAIHLLELADVGLFEPTPIELTRLARDSRADKLSRSSPPLPAVTSVNMSIDAFGHVSDALMNNVLIATLVGVYGATLTKEAYPLVGATMKQLLHTHTMPDVLRLFRDLLMDSYAYLQYFCLGGDPKKLFSDPLTVSVLEYTRLNNAYDEFSMSPTDLKRAVDMLRVTAQREFDRMTHQKDKSATAWSHHLDKVLNLSTAVGKLPTSYSKVEPAFVLLEGPPGYGKTTWIKKHVGRFVSSVMAKPNPRDGSFEKMYTKSDPKFDPGYSPNTLVEFFDDYFFHSSPGTGNTVIKDMLTLLGPDVTFAAAAEVELKGVIPKLPVLVFNSENSFDSLSLWTNGYPAYFRRAQLWLTFQVRHEMPDGTVLDYDRDIEVTVARYLPARSFQIKMGSKEVIYKGPPDGAADVVARELYVYGVAARRRHLALGANAPACPVCGSAHCTVPETEPYSAHMMTPVPAVAVSGLATGLYWSFIYVYQTWLTSLLILVWTTVLGTFVTGDIEAVRPYATNTYYVTGVMVVVYLTGPLHFLSMFAFEYPLLALSLLTRTVWPTRIADFAITRVMRLSQALWHIWVFYGPTDGVPNMAATYLAAGLTERIYFSMKVKEFLSSGRYQALKQLAAIVGGIALIWAGYRNVLSDPTAAKIVEKKADPDTPRPTVDEQTKAATAAAMPLADTTMRRWRRPISPIHTEQVAVAVVGPNIVLTVNHFFYNETVYDVTRSPTVRGSIPTVRGNPVPASMVFPVGEDLVLVYDRFSNLYNPKVGLTVVDKDILAFELRSYPDGKLTVELVTAYYMPPDQSSWVKDGRSYGRDRPKFTTCGPGEDGNCGSVLVVPNDRDGFDIFAVLVATDRKEYCMYTPVTQETLAVYNRLRVENSDRPSTASIQKLAAVSGVAIVSAPMHPKSALLYAHEDALTYVGRVVPERSVGETNSMVETMFTKDVAEIMSLPNLFARPQSKPKFDPTYGYPRGMMTAFVEDANLGRNTIAEFPEVQDAARRFFNAALRRAGLKRARPLTLRESLNGTQSGTRGINRKTSVGGLNRQGNKKLYLVDAPCEHYPNGVDVKPEMAAVCQDVMDHWCAGKHYPIVCTIMPKGNEVRGFDKKIARSIGMVAMEGLTSNRALVEPIHAALRAVPEFGFMGGKNALGPDWGYALRTMQRVNRKLAIDADQRAFDKVHQVLMKDFYTTLMTDASAHIYHTTGYNVAVRQAIDDNNTVYYVWKGEVFLGCATVNSGKSGTTEQQTLFALIIWLIGVALAYPEVPRSVMFAYDEPNPHMATIAGGDDGVAALGEELRPFRAGDVQKHIAYLGYTVTSDADKSKPPQEVPWDEVTFFKRRFRVEGERTFAPLAIKSISKSLHWRDSHSTLALIPQHKELLEGAAREFFLYGRDVYAERVSQLAQVAERHRIAAVFLSYDELLTQYDNRSLTTSAWAFEDMTDVVHGVCDCKGFHVLNISEAVSGVTDVAVGDEFLHLEDGTDEAPHAAVYHDVVDSICGDCERVPQLVLEHEPTDVWLERSVAFTSFTWTSGFTGSRSPLADIFANTYMQPRMNYFLAMRTKLRVTVTVSVPPTYMGLMVIGMVGVPAAGLNTVPTMNQMVSWDSVAMIDLAQSNRAVLEIPFFMWQHVIALYGSASGAATGVQLFFRELSPVTASDGSPTDTPELTVTYSMVDPQMSLPTPFDAVSGVVPTHEFRPSAVVDSAIKFVEPLKKIPVLGSIVGAAQKVAKVGSDFLKLFGFSAPSLLPEMTWMVPRTTPGWATGAAHDAAMKLSIQPQAAQNPSRVDVEGLGGDALTFANIFRRWGYGGRITWTTSSSVGAYIANIPVHPMFTGQLGDFMPMGIGLLTHDAWSGDIEYMFYISATKFLRGRLAIFWSPNATLPVGTLTNLNALTAADVVYVDISGSTKMMFTVPWGAATPWLSSSAMAQTTWQSEQPVAANANGWIVNGWLNIVVVEGLAANTATAPTLYIQIFARAGENFRVMNPSLDVARQYYAISGVFAADAIQNISHRFKGLIVPDEMLAACGGGEQLVTFRTELHRRALSCVYQPQPTAATAAYSNFRVSLCDPPIMPSFTYMGNTGDFQTFTTTLFSVLAACFVAWRGSIRHTCEVIPSTAAGVLNNGSLTITRANRDAGYVSQMYQAATASVNGFITEYMDKGAEQVLMKGGSQADAISVDVPYASQNYVCQCAKRSAATSGAILQFSGYAGSNQSVVIKQYVAAGDDIQFYGWIGLPTLTNFPQTNYGWALW